MEGAEACWLATMADEDRPGGGDSGDVTVRHGRCEGRDITSETLFSFYPKRCTNTAYRNYSR